MNAIDTRPDTESTNTTNQIYHHHTKSGQVRTLQDLDQQLVALCGAVRFRLDNPLAYPCCPKCAEKLRNPCIGQEIDRRGHEGDSQ